MKRSIVLMTALALAGCAPRITQASKGGVTVEGWGFFQAQGVEDIAAAHCRAEGKIAHQVLVSPYGEWVRYRYECQ